MVLGDLVRGMARRSPRQTGLIFEGAEFSWAEVNERVNRLGNALLSLGLVKGDAIGIVAQNSHRYVEIYYALAKTGLISVPIGWQSAPPEIAYILNDSGAKAVIVDAEYLPVLESIASQLDSVKLVICMGDGGGNSLNYDSLLRGSRAGEPEAEVCPDNVRSLAYTSGTTGKPKGCIITQGQMLATIQNFLVEIPVPREQPTLLTVPLYTGYGGFQAFAAAYTRSTIVVQRRFKPQFMFEAIQQHRIAHMLVVPTMIVAMCNAPEIENYDLSALHLLVYGGSVIAPAILKRAMQYFKCDFCQNFGMMEAGGFIAFLTSEDHRLDGTEAKEKRLLSTGREAQYAEVRLRDDNGREVAAGVVGEMTVRSDSSISGYWKMPERTAELVRDGWIYTGDMAYRDEDGYIYVVDRKKEMIVSGGMNIYPAEIETVLYMHPAVAQVAVIGVPDDHWGEAVKAIIEFRKGEQATEEEILEFCQERLAAYKKPKSVEFVDSIPVGSSGKVVKRELRERYWQGRERRV